MVCSLIAPGQVNSKAQWRLSLQVFFFVFASFSPKKSQKRKADLVLQKYAARADVAPRRAELLLYSQRIASRNIGAIFT